MNQYSTHAGQEFYESLGDLGPVVRDLDREMCYLAETGRDWAEYDRLKIKRRRLVS